ncbi:membrane-spanning 4-domains subfamily A member 15-like [Silurus meridionalis]|uniref:Membrane-spanning 4-domains subfamily A member 4A-like n=1 Tax=Silurus meridionalis TaxID=175797 RepID=A0A8T0BZF4_SILME|nr:membrane-spanning 4-domains subfamily A member 15-like [Silurus meridionalis]KAF7711060.1 hypothetical protein HF521_000071 [Silurus meridionalis]
MDTAVVKESPKALGTVQMMIGVVIFFFGDVLKNIVNGVTVHSYITYWGSICFICTGALSVSSVDWRKQCVMKATLVMNVFSVVSAVLAVILFSIDLGPSSFRAILCKPCFYQLSMYYCQLQLKQVLGTIGVLLVFSLLEILVSIAMFVLTWKARSSIEIL